VFAITCLFYDQLRLFSKVPSRYLPALLTERRDVAGGR
jgi:hypothetical protein